MAFKSLGKLLPRHLKQAGIHRDVQASRIVTIANEILDEWFGKDTTSYNAKAVSIKYKKLSIASANASLRQELHFKKDDLRKEVNKRVGENIVEEIKIVI